MAARSDAFGAGIPRIDTLELVEQACTELLDELAPMLAAAETTALNEGEGREVGAVTAEALAARVRLLTSGLARRDDMLTMAELRALARGLPPGITLELTGMAERDEVVAPVGRVLLNLVLLAAGSLPCGGAIRVAGSPGDLFLQIDGPHAAWPSGTALCLVDREEALRRLMSGQHFRLGLAATMAHETGVRVSVLHPMGGATPAMLRLNAASG